MYPEDIVAWLLEAEVITEQQATNLREIANRERTREQEQQMRYVDENRAAFDALPWWKRLGGYRYGKWYPRP